MFKLIFMQFASLFRWNDQLLVTSLLAHTGRKFSIL